MYDQVRRGGRWLWQRPNREGGAEMREDVVSWGQRLHGDQTWRRSGGLTQVGERRLRRQRRRWEQVRLLGFPVVVGVVDGEVGEHPGRGASWHRHLRSTVQTGSETRTTITNPGK